MTNSKPLQSSTNKQGGRGYFGIGVYYPKTEANIGILWRHARLYGADFIFTIGRRYRKESGDTSNTSRHTPLFHYEDYDDFDSHRPSNSNVVCVEQREGAKTLPETPHPEQAIYLLGAEDRGLPEEILRGKQCIEIPTKEPQSMNVATAGTLIMYDRFVKGTK